MYSDIYAELFERGDSCREALIAKFQYFTHDTPDKYLPCIKKNGLVPHEVTPSSGDEFIRYYECRRKITCLRPVGAELCPKSSGPPPFARLAVSSLDLPRLLSLDWSYDWGLARVLREGSPQRSSVEIFVEVARRRGSIAVYDPIPAIKLTVWQEGLPDDPALWPRLAETAESEIKTFRYNSPCFD